MEENVDSKILVVLITNIVYKINRIYRFIALEHIVE